MVRHDLRSPRRPELKAEMSVFNLALKLSFPHSIVAGPGPSTVPFEKK
jgi:hypothetical protein